MPLKLNVGYSQKVGQPDYGSLGASCNIEVELDQHLLFHDLDGLHAKVKSAFVACKQAVQDELYRCSNHPPTSEPHHGSSHSGNGASSNGHHQRHTNGRKALASQVRAINSISDRLQLDLAKWLQQKFGLRMRNELSISDASDTIDELKALRSGNNGGHH